MMGTELDIGYKELSRSLDNLKKLLSWLKNVMGRFFVSLLTNSRSNFRNSKWWTQKLKIDFIWLNWKRVLEGFPGLWFQIRTRNSKIQNIRLNMSDVSWSTILNPPSSISEYVLVVLLPCRKKSWISDDPAKAGNFVQQLHLLFKSHYK